MRDAARQGLLGDGGRPGPIGSTAPSPMPNTPPPAPAVGQELNLVGSFPKPASWTPQQELKLIQADTWFPSTLDFKAVAGSGSIEITNTWDFLLKIVKSTAKIARLNFFSHGTASLIALQGEILADGSNVLLAQNADTGWTQVISSSSTAILDPFAKTWGSFGESSGKSVTADSTTFTLDDVRAKFASNATIWLYLCHGAADPLLFQEVANTFQVTAKGFAHEIVFCAPNNFPTSRKHKVAVVTTAKPADSCVNGDTDFKKLDSNTSVRTATPRKPP